jgi:hypothetical protein
MQQVIILTAWTLTVAVLGFYAGRASLAQEISALRRQRYVLSQRWSAERDSRIILSQRMYERENRR